MAFQKDKIAPKNGLKVDGVSVPPGGAQGVQGSGESQDHAFVAAGEDCVMAVVADGVSRALSGGTAADKAVQTAVETFRNGTVEAYGLMSSVLDALWNLNQSREQEEANIGALPCQCMCVLAVIQQSGAFQWAAVGDCVIELGDDDEAHVLTHQATACAQREMHRVGAPPEDLRIFHGENEIPAGKRLRLYSDGFEEWMADCVGKSFTEIKRFLRRGALSDDTTVIQIWRG